jgi:hypothetical protein
LPFQLHQQKLQLKYLLRISSSQKMSFHLSKIKQHWFRQSQIKWLCGLTQFWGFTNSFVRPQFKPWWNQRFHLWSMENLGRLLHSVSMYKRFKLIDKIYKDHVHVYPFETSIEVICYKRRATRATFLWFIRVLSADKHRLCTD